MWDMGNGWGWWMAFGWIWMIGLIAIVVWAVSSLARQGASREQERPRDTQATPLEVLERRYAGGELSDEQFERMRRQLHHPSGT